MATPRGHIVDDEAVGTYHCISRWRASRGHPPTRTSEGKSRTPTDPNFRVTSRGEGKSRKPTDHELPRDFPEDAFAMATLASIGASEQKAAKHGDTTRTHRR